MQVRGLLITVVGLFALLTACGSSGGADASGASGGSAAVSTSTLSALPKETLPTDPCALLTNGSVKETMGWPATADVHGEPIEPEGVAPACVWNHTDDEGNPDVLSLAIYTRSEMEQQFADPRAVVKETDNDRIQTLAFGDLHPAAVARFGDDAVLVGIGDESPDRPDPVEVAADLLETYSA